MRPVSWVFGIFMVINGLGHFAGSGLSGRRDAGGVLFSFAAGRFDLPADSCTQAREAGGIRLRAVSMGRASRPAAGGRISRCWIPQNGRGVIWPLKRRELIDDLIFGYSLIAPLYRHLWKVKAETKR